MHSVAVSWGFNDTSLLAKHEPTALVDTPEQLAIALGLDPTLDEPAGAHPDKGNGGAHPA
jgi:hypothetical protein